MCDFFASHLSISWCFRVIIRHTPALSALSLAFCNTSLSISRHCIDVLGICCSFFAFVIILFQIDLSKLGKC